MYYLFCAYSRREKLNLKVPVGNLEAGLTFRGFVVSVCVNVAQLLCLLFLHLFLLLWLSESLLCIQEDRGFNQNCLPQYGAKITHKSCTQTKKESESKMDQRNS